MLDLIKAARAAEQAAYAAGTHLQASRSRLSEVVVTQLSPDDVVRTIDHETQALIREVVLKQFPDHGFVGTGASDVEHHVAACADERPHWIVDALDGSANYMRGYPQYAVSIALVDRGKAVVGVVYDPVRNEFFGAIRGHGAVLNGQKIRCAAARPPLESLAATVFPKPSTPRMADYIAEFGRVLRGFGGVRRSGSMVLELAYLASGRIDGFWAHDVGPCNAAAGILLLRECRGLIESRDGLPLLESRSLVACTRALRDPLWALLGDEQRVEMAIP
jgi:myo-inositol-1(or 4)-monophosphatase